MKIATNFVALCVCVWDCHHLFHILLSFARAMVNTLKEEEVCYVLGQIVDEDQLLLLLL